jgi:hypothetical protein
VLEELPDMWFFQLSLVFRKKPSATFCKTIIMWLLPWYNKVCVNNGE